MRIVALLLLGLLLLCPGLSQGKTTLMDEDIGVVDALTYGATTSARNSTTLAAAVADIGSARRTLMLSAGTWTVSSNLTIPATLTLWIPAGTVLSLNSGVVLTVQGPLHIDGCNVFTGTAIPILASSSVLQVCWFGVVGDGTTNDSAAILAALTSAPPGATVEFPANKNFKISGSTLVIDRRLTLRGHGSTLTHTSSQGFILNAPTDISGFTFVSALTSTAVDVALYSRQAVAGAVDISGTYIHDNRFGRVSISLWDNDSEDTTPNAAGIWLERNVWTGDYTNATPGDTYNLLDLRGWSDLFILHNRFDVVNPERFLKISKSDRRVHITGNTFRSASGVNGKQAIDLFADTREVIITQNIWDLNATETHCVEAKTGDGGATFSEPSEILVVGNLCKLTTTATSAGAFAFFGSWGLTSQTLSRSLCQVSNNEILSTFTTNVSPNILVRGFTHATISHNSLHRDISVSAPTFTYGIEASNNRHILISGNLIDYGIILVNGSASHPNATTYTGEPETVTITGNTQRAYKSLGALYFPNGTVGQLTVTNNILNDTGTGSGSGGFLRLESSTVANLLMTSNQGYTQGSTDIVLASGGAISTTAVVVNNSWQKATATWNPGTIASAASGFTNINILGAQVGDLVTVGLPYSLQGASLEARVSGPGSVLLSIDNNTGGDKTYGSGTWSIQTSRQ